MTRLLEVIVALIIVAILAVVIGVLMPSTGHVERTVAISHNMQHIDDVVNNFRNFSKYAALRSYDPRTQFKVSGEPFGVGARVSWDGDGPKVGTGSLEIISSEPGHVVWAIDNDWRGENKRFTIDIERSDNQKLVEVTWSYDVDYGWDLLDRYSQLYLHGDPASFIQYSLDGMETLLANIPNIGYADLSPLLVETPPQPVLLVSTKAPRSLNQIAIATNAAMQQIEAAMKRLGVSATGPRVIFTTDWGDQEYRFDVAVPIDASSLTIDGETYELRSAEMAKQIAKQAAKQAAEESDADDEAPLPAPPQPGDYASGGFLIVDDNVRATMAFGGRALVDEWHGSPAGVTLMRLALKAYAGTHGYEFNEYVDRFYDVLLSDLDEVAVDNQDFAVYLPVSDAPARTPEQTDADAPAPGLTAMPSPAASVEAAAAASTADDPEAE